MLTAQQILDAIWGPTYLVDRTGRILLVGQRHWSALLDDAPGQPVPQSLIGRNLFEFIAGGDVQALYRRVLERLQEDPTHAWEMDYRCDTPGMRRELRMTVSSVPGTEPSFLFCSQVLREGQRPPISIFDYQRALDFMHDPTVPIVLICSICHRVKAREGDEFDSSTWIEPEEYYRSGGDSRVSLSHGLCPSCYADFMTEAGLPERLPPA